MGHTRSHWTGFYQPDISDNVKPVSNDLPLMLSSMETAADGTVSRALDQVTAGPWPKITTEGSGARFVDQNGNPIWLGFGGDGALDDTAKWAVANAIGFYTGPDQPIVYPGRSVIWQPTDPLTGLPFGDPQLGRN